MNHPYLDPNRAFDFTGDGFSLTPAETGRLLAHIAQEKTIPTDTYLEGGVVTQLETRMARRLNKEAALFVPTGTLANHLALTALSGEGSAILVDQTSHVSCDAGHGLERFAGRVVVPLSGDRAGFNPSAVEEAVERLHNGKVPLKVGAISLESPMRRRSGEAIAADRFSALIKCARKHDINIHLDAARLFIGCAYGDQDPRDICEQVDTVYLSLWKCFHAPSGAILAGSQSVIDAARAMRRAMGGCPPAGWPAAAIALHFLEADMAPFREVRQMADAVCDHLTKHHRVVIERIPNGTSIVHMKLTESAMVFLPVRFNQTLLGRPLNEVAAAILRHLEQGQ